MSNDTPHTGEDTNFKLMPMLRHYEEKRRYPRIDMRLPVIVTTGDNEVLQARLRDISAEGMQIRCDPEIAGRLHPQRTQIMPGAGPEVMVRVELTTADGTRPLAGRARLCYIAVKSPEEIAFGLQFVHLPLDSKKLLADFILECMQPAV